MKNCAVFLILSLASGLKFSKINEAPEFEKDEESKPKSLGQLLGDLSFGQGCPNSKAPTVAVCIAGLSRRFAHPAQTAYLNSALLQPIKDAGAIGLTRGHPDVFVHTKLGAYPGVAQTRDAADHGLSNTMENVVAAAKEVGAVDYVIEEGWGSAHSREQLANPSCFHPHGAIEGVMSYYYSIHGCLEQIKKVEEEKGQRYDFVIQLRPDNHVLDEDKQHMVTGIQCKKSMYVSDGLAYQTRAAAEVYGSVWNDQFQNANPSLCSMKEQNEQFTRDAAQRINSKVGPAEYLR